MDKIADALGPWPLLQLFFGATVLGVGVYATMRGLASSKGGRMSMEDARQEWEAYQQLESIERHTEEIAENQKVMLDRVNQCTEAIKQLAVSINALSAALWNRGV